KKNLSYIIPAALGLMWLISSYDKLLNVEGFYWILYNYRAFPDEIQGAGALCFPVFEVLLGLTLIFRYRLKSGYLITAVIMIFFIILLSITYMRGIDLNCGCFSIGQNNSNLIFRIIEDLIILVVAIVGFFIQNKIDNNNSLK
ncbi:MAG: hypothetical protein KAR38_14395, partial [Calditrichia bacterium]|nr:hypothetical protein [Calditrichia bacterium]